jgi:hypothetical protein
MYRTLLHRCAVLAGAILTLALLAPAAHATNPGARFPGFPALKDSLGNLPLVEDVTGNVEKVYVADCRKVADSLLASFSSAMNAKGYHVTARPLLGVGLTLSDEKQYRHLENWKRDHGKSEELFESGPPPLFVDSTQCADSLVRSKLATLLKRTASLDLSDVGSMLFSDAIPLRDWAGSDHILLLALVSNRVPQGKSFMHSMLPMPAELGALSMLKACDPQVNNGIILPPVSSMLCRIAIVDCRDGSVLWADGECQPHTFSENQVTNITANILKHLP